MTDRCSSSFQFKKPERIIKRGTKRKKQKNLWNKIRREVPVCLAWAKILLNYYKPPLFIFGVSERLLFSTPKTFSFKPFFNFFFLIKTNQPVDEKVPLRVIPPVFSQILSSVIGQMTKPCTCFSTALSEPIIHPQVSMSLSTS